MLTQIKTDLIKQLAPALEISEADLVSVLESPKAQGHGQLALPVFSWAKKLKKAPPVIAQEMAQLIEGLKLPQLERVVALSGFVNFHFRIPYLLKVLMEGVEGGADKIGYSNWGQGKRIVIDFSSPNVAKPMSIGHMRATMIGQAIYNLAKTQGFEVLGLNHLGDWGSQFGKLAWAFLKWGHEYPVEEKPIDSLFQMYVRFEREAESDPAIADQGAKTFKRLEQGDPEIHRLWQKFVELSMKDYSRLFRLMGAHHDLVLGESFYNDKMKPTEKLLEDQGLLVEDAGAMVVHVGEEMPPCLIRKSDGASLYATRDLASAIYRHDHLKADINLYVVGMDQTLHFRQVFKVLELMGYSWAKDCHHIAFGMYRFKDIGRMSTRKGNVVFFEDVASRAIQMVREVIAAKNPDLADKELVAEQVGVGAVIFNDLVNDRVKNVDFDWDRVLDFEGDSGPYVQYMNVRALSLQRKFGRPIKRQFDSELSSPEELELIRLLLAYPEILRSAYSGFKPHLLAGYTLDVCHQFSQFYSKHRILGEGREIEDARMSLVYCFQRILSSALSVLNIPCPQAM